MTDQPQGPLRPAGDLAWRQPGKTSCPSCGATQDAFSYPRRQVDDPRQPRTGDYAVCTTCAVVNIIVVSPALGSVTLREATTEELAEFSRHRKNTDVVRALHLVDIDRRRPRER